MNEEEKIIVLNFERGEVHIFSYESVLYKDPLDFLLELEEYQFCDGGIQYMVVKSLKIEIH